MMNSRTKTLDQYLAAAAFGCITLCNNSLYKGIFCKDDLSSAIFEYCTFKAFSYINKDNLWPWRITNLLLYIQHLYR